MEIADFGGTWCRSPWFLQSMVRGSDVEQHQVAFHMVEVAVKLLWRRNWKCTR